MTIYQDAQPAMYQVFILSPDTGDVLAILDTSSMQRLRYKRAINEPGMVQISLPASHSAAALLSVRDQLVEVLRYPSPDDPQVEGTFLMRKLQRFTDEDDVTWLVAGGVSLEHLLQRRVIVPDEDPLMAGGYSTKSGPADNVMTELVRQQCGPGASAARQITGLAVPVPAGTGNEVGGRWRYENLHDVLDELAAASGTDFRIERTGGSTLEFIAEPIGEDKTLTGNYPLRPVVLFSPELGAMAEPEYTLDATQEATYAYLLGNGQGEDREVYEAASTRMAESIWNRIEIAEDAQLTDEEESPLIYLTKAAALLADHEPRASFEFDLPASQYVHYRERFDLGDQVTAQWSDVRADVRIMAVEVNVAAREEIKLDLEVLQWT